MTIKKGDWVQDRNDPGVIHIVQEIDVESIDTAYGLYCGVEREVLEVVTSLPKPKLTKKELVAWLKEQNGWRYIASGEEHRLFTVTCHGMFTYHAKTLSVAIRRLRKAMGVT